MTKIHRLCGLVVGFMISNAGLAHDFWMEARPFYTEPGQTVELSLHVGNDYVGDSMPNVPSWYQSFNIYHPGKETEVEGEMGRDPAGYFTPAEEGTYLIGYNSIFNTTALDSDTFLKYLGEEGLINARKTFLTSKNPPSLIRERYMRHVKSLVQTGDKQERDDSQLVIGHEFELVPQSNPYRLRHGDALAVKLIYQGRPARNILVAAFSQKHPELAQRIRTDDSGQVTIKLDQTGPWLIKAVKIIKLVDEEQDWESHWASLTFSMR